MAIVQMFNQSFLSIARSLPRLSKLGITHLLVSPPQKSNPSKQWWARYQPVDFRLIEGPLGTSAELEALCLAARRSGMVVLVDAVLNHMSNLPHYVSMKGRQVLSARFPRFSAPDFCRPGHKRDPLPYRGRALPELNLGSPWVQSELRNYLRLLISLGVGGFRIDAARHIEPGHLAAILQGLPSQFLLLAEIVVARASQLDPAYLNLCQAYDFPLAHALKTAFAPGGDLRSLLDPRAADLSLWGPRSVTFVNHHDLVKSPRRFDYFRIANLVDRDLAQVFLLARCDGTPYLYHSDLRRSLVKAALTFRRHLRTAEQQWIGAGPNHLILRRGSHLLAAINKSGRSWSHDRLPTGLEDGLYLDLVTKQRVPIGPDGYWNGATVAARSARLLVAQALL